MQSLRSGSSSRSYTADERRLPCEVCAAPMSVPIEGGSVTCPKCTATFTARPQPDTRVPPTAPSDEQGRRERLRAQDGKPTLPPKGYEHLVSGSDVPPHKMEDALKVWNVTRTWLLEKPDDLSGAERLVWLTMVLRNTLEDQRATRALLEGALESLALPSHRQQMLGHLARGAAKEHDWRSADEWLARCDPASEDLPTDSAYRISRALVDTGKTDFQAVIDLLGGTEEEVPIDDSMDPIAVTLRANAWERLGRVDAAEAELTKYMVRGKAATIEGIIAGTAGFTLCPQSIHVARGHARVASGERAASKSGGGTGWMLIAMGVGMPVVMLTAFSQQGSFQWPMLAILVMPCIVIPMGIGMIRRAARSKEIALHGIHGRGKIRAVNATGTSINKVPVVLLDVEVTVEGHPPCMAVCRRLMRGGDQLIGLDFPVIWHPKYPKEVVLEA